MSLHRVFGIRNRYGREHEHPAIFIVQKPAESQKETMESINEGGLAVMEDRYGMETFTIEREHVETEIVDSRCGPKMTISVCNAAVPAYWIGVTLKASEIFMHIYAEVYGKPPESIYVDGKLMACLDRRVPAAQKLSLHIVIVAEEGGGSETRDYMIDVPILPGNEHYAEARQCFMDEFEVMLGGRQETMGEKA